ncbi:MAG: histidine phosphatase family protein [Acetobacteraceae bacterium]
MTSPPRTVYFNTHPDVLIDPAEPVTDWRLSPAGRARMTAALARPWLAGVRTIWCSTERKARDGADILAKHFGLPVTELAALGENDRSATGYLPRAEFEALADAFFARPQESVRGWERAIDAQHRIVAAVETVLTASAGSAGDIAIVAHGGVGTLLLCHLRGMPIGRRHDQPPNNGGNYFVFDAVTRRVRHGWTAIDA